MTGSPFRILEEAISDVGCWRCWTHKLPGSVQLEFGFIQLRRTGGPTAKRRLDPIALRFQKPALIAFVERSGPTRPPRDWQKRLAHDKWEPQPVGKGSLALCRAGAARAALREASRITVTYGENPPGNGWKACPATLALWCGAVGVVVAADSLEIVTHMGKLPIEKVAVYHRAWWEYWKKYWSRVDTPSPLPYDGVCEVCIPAGGDRMLHRQRR